jgi:biopolymer transport protein ExbD
LVLPVPQNKLPSRSRLFVLAIVIAALAACNNRSVNAAQQKLDQMRSNQARIAQCEPLFDYPIDGNIRESFPQKLAIGGAGEILWNGTPIDIVTLDKYLRQTQERMPYEKVLLNIYPKTSYEKLDEIYSVILKSGFCDRSELRSPTTDRMLSPGEKLKNAAKNPPYHTPPVAR